MQLTSRRCHFGSAGRSHSSSLVVDSGKKEGVGVFNLYASLRAVTYPFVHAILAKTQFVGVCFSVMSSSQCCSLNRTHNAVGLTDRKRAVSWRGASKRSVQVNHPVTSRSNKYFFRFVQTCESSVLKVSLCHFNLPHSVTQKTRTWTAVRSFSFAW